MLSAASRWTTQAVRPAVVQQLPGVLRARWCHGCPNGPGSRCRTRHRRRSLLVLQRATPQLLTRRLRAWQLVARQVLTWRLRAWQLVARQLLTRRLRAWQLVARQVLTRRLRAWQPTTRRVSATQRRGCGRADTDGRARPGRGC